MSFVIFSYCETFLTADSCPAFADHSAKRLQEAAQMVAEEFREAPRILQDSPEMTRDWLQTMPEQRRKALSSSWQDCSGLFRNTVFFAAIDRDTAFEYNDFSRAAGAVSCLFRRVLAFSRSFFNLIKQLSMLLIFRCLCKRQGGCKQ